MSRTVPRPIALVILAALTLAGPPARAQRPDSAAARTDTLVSSLQEIVVQARRPVTTVGGATALDLRVDSLRLPPAPSLEMVLREVPALHVRRNSRGEAELSVRGSDSRQVAVLVDGIPLTIAWDGRADVSVIPATAPQRIEFTRGLSSMLNGPNVLGGVVEISLGSHLRQPPAASAQLATGLDRAGGFGTSGSVTLPFASDAGRWLVRAGGGFADSPGQPLARGVVEPLPAGDGLRRNTDSRSLDGFATLRFHDNSGAWFSFAGSGFRARRGIAAELGVDRARFWRYPHVSRTVVVASAGTGQRAALFGGTGDLEASVGLDLGRSEIDAYASRAYDRATGFEDGRDRGLTLRLLGDHTLGGRGELRAAFTLSDVRHDEALPAGEARYRQQLWSAGGETVWRLVDEGRGAVSSLRLSAGAALDAGRTPETGGREPLGSRSAWGARMGFTMALADGGTLLHGGVSRRVRFPSLRELYSAALDRFAPNPALRPERLVALEAGVTTRLGRRGEVQAVAFRHELADAVVRITLPDRRFQRVNRNRLESRGLEVIASTVVGPVAVSGDLTWQRVDLTDPVAGVTNRPENLPGFFGSVRAGFPVGLGVRATAEAAHTGRQWCIDPGTGRDTRLDGGTMLNGELSRVWHLASGGLLSRLEGRLSLDNAGNLALYDQCGLPRPGRLLRIQLRLF
jgi:iron complex outermembrane recepter protein